MKSVHRVLTLLLPACLVRAWLWRRHAVKVPPVPGNWLTKAVFAVLPYAFTATLSVRVESDCRLIKYFVPYGKMKKHVYLAYRMDVGDRERDRGVVGAVRAVMPYGLVLWWDAEDHRNPRNIAVRKPQDRKAAGDSDFRINHGWRMPERERLEFQRVDKAAAMTLRLLIMGSGKVR